MGARRYIRRSRVRPAAASKAPTQEQLLQALLDLSDASHSLALALNTLAAGAEDLSHIAREQHAKLTDDPSSPFGSIPSIPSTKKYARKSSGKAKK